MTCEVPEVCLSCCLLAFFGQPAFPFIWPAVQSLRRGLSTNPGVKCGAYVGAVEEMMCIVCVNVTEGA